MNKLTVHGKTCYFRNDYFLSNNKLKGGLLIEPATFCIGVYTLSFDTLYIFSDSGMIYGGFLSETHIIEIGTAKSKFPISSAFFYNSEEIEFAQLEYDTTVKVGQVKYTFAAKEDLYFYPDGIPMRGQLNPALVKVLGREIKIHSIGFWETGIISGLIPLENTQLEVQGKVVDIKGANGEMVHSNYSLDFTMDGKLKSITLSDRSLLNLSFDDNISFL